jgi:hypothetical protein
VIEALGHIFELENIEASPRRIGLVLGDSAYLDLQPDGSIRVLVCVKRWWTWLHRRTRLSSIGTLKAHDLPHVAGLLRDGVPLQARFVAIDAPHMTGHGNYCLRVSVWAPTSVMNVRLGRLRRSSGVAIGPDNVPVLRRYVPGISPRMFSAKRQSLESVWQNHSDEEAQSKRGSREPGE